VLVAVPSSVLAPPLLPHFLDLLLLLRGQHRHHFGAGTVHAGPEGGALLAVAPQLLHAGLILLQVPGPDRLQAARLLVGDLELAPLFQQAAHRVEHPAAGIGAGAGGRLIPGLGGRGSGVRQESRREGEGQETLSLHRDASHL
jgi:hypothetical protein